MVKSLEQAIDYKNGNKNAARSTTLEVDEDVTTIGVDIAPFKDIGVETTVVFKNGSIIEYRPTTDNPIRSSRYKQPN